MMSALLLGESSIFAQDPKTRSFTSQSPKIHLS
jgi:hypothetical protein